MCIRDRSYIIISKKLSGQKMNQTSSAVELKNVVKKFDEVIEALHEIEVNFFCYWDVTGRGNEKIGKVYRGISYSTKDIERTLLSIVVSDSFVEKSIKAIIDSGATGEIGDGKIFLYNCEEAYRIRTGETGPKSFN